MIKVKKVISDAIKKGNYIIDQFDIDTASGHFLDRWGYWVGVERKPRESDDKFRQRLVDKLHDSKRKPLY